MPKAGKINLLDITMYLSFCCDVPAVVWNFKPVKKFETRENCDFSKSWFPTGPLMCFYTDIFLFTVRSVGKPGRMFGRELGTFIFSFFCTNKWDRSCFGTSGQLALCSKQTQMRKKKNLLLVSKIILVHPHMEMCSPLPTFSQWFNAMKEYNMNKGWSEGVLCPRSVGLRGRRKSQRTTLISLLRLNASRFHKWWCVKLHWIWPKWITRQEMSEEELSLVTT